MIKKILWLLCLFPIFIGKVYASEVYYSEYTPFSDWSVEQVETSDIRNVEMENRYLWYRMDKALGDYAPYEKGGEFTDDCYITEPTELSTDKPEEKEYRTIETVDQFIYQIAKGVRYIHFTNLKGSYSAIRFTELNVSIDGQDVNYTVECTNCRDGFEQNIHNGIIAENKSYVNNGGSFVIDLGKVYPLFKIDLHFYIFDMGTEDKTFTIGFSEDKTNIYASQSYTSQFTHTTASEAKYFRYSIYNMNIPEEYWLTTDVVWKPYFSEYKLSETFVSYYSYQEKWCRAYQDVKTYNDTYTKEATGNYIYRDDTRVRPYYRYQTRDKLELSDIDTITQRDFDMNRLVINSTQPYTIEQKIDFTKNGTYPVIFRVGNLEVAKDIHVQVLENQVDDYEAKIVELKAQINEYQNDISQLQEQLRQLQHTWQEEKTAYENRIDILEEQILGLQQELLSCQDDCAKKEECLNNLINEKDKLLKEYEDKLLECSNQINTYQSQLQQRKEEVKQLKTQNKEYQKTINFLEKQMDEMIQNSKELNDKMIADYQNQLTGKDNLLDAYTKKINELTNQLNRIQQNIGQVVEERNQFQNENRELQKIIDGYQKQKENLQQQLDEQKANNNCGNISKELELSKQEKNELNQKLNNYILKIRRNEKGNWIWISSLILLFSCIVVLKGRKKSKIK